jgi:hypothetical protein
MHVSLEPAHSSALYSLGLCVPSNYLPPRQATLPRLGITKMTRGSKSEILDPLSGPERLMLFCIASRMDPAMAGLPHRTAELLVMKNLALRDQARLSLSDQGRIALFSLLGGGRENRDGGGPSPRVHPPMPLSLASLIRRRLIALIPGPRPVALVRRDCAVAAVSLRAKRRRRCSPSEH